MCGKPRLMIVKIGHNGPGGLFLLAADNAASPCKGGKEQSVFAEERQQPDIQAVIGVKGPVQIKGYGAYFLKHGASLPERKRGGKWVIFP